tara:strand:+ start:9387 stop:9923 length:537 start_codon:yes stop_codon:yes gene_type:complete
MASSTKTESVNAVEIKHLAKSFENLSKAVALSAKEVKSQFDKVLTLLDKYKDDTKSRQDKTDKIANEIRNEIKALTKSNEDTKQLCFKNKESINVLEKQYVSRKYFHTVGGIAILVWIASMSWQDLQTQRYFDELESTISLSQHEKQELEQYKKLNQHLLTPEVLEIIRHYKEAKKGM